MECGFGGNPDIYGIGIRIGYYTQALAVWFANYFHFREARVLRSVNNLFLVAVSIVGLIYIYDARNIYAVEAFLLLYIGITIAIISMLDSTRFTYRFMEISNERMVSKMVISVMGQVFLVYFWWRGLDIMRPTPCQQLIGRRSNTVAITNNTGEGTYGFYIVPANMYGWLRTLMRIISLIGVTRSAMVLTSIDPMKVLHSMLTRKTKAAFIKASVRNLLQEDATARLTSVTLQSPRSQSPRPHERSNNPISTSSLPSAATTVGNLQTHELTHPSNLDNETEIFSAVYEAEHYLDSIFAICETSQARLRPERVVSIRFGCMRCQFPIKPIRQTSGLVPLRKCFHAWWMWYGIDRISMNLRWRFHIHLAGLNRGPLLIWPRLLHRAYQLSKDKRPPDWKMVAIASDVQLSQMPLQKSTKLWAFQAVQNLLLIIILAIQVELTIIWNHVSGLNSLTSVGQLIPFILGVGGLLNVLWSKWRLLRSGVREGSGLEMSPATRYEAAIETYLKWKRAHRAPSTSGPSEHVQQEQSAQSTADKHKSSGNVLPGDVSHDPSSIASHDGPHDSALRTGLNHGEEGHHLDQT